MAQATAVATGVKEQSLHDPKVAAEPSGPKGDVHNTAGSGPTKVQSPTPENKLGAIDPSAPGNTGITPGTAGEKS
ncbi:hypothetical protein SAMN05421770_101119 [Granulicella rosea]|uniref:Uncharacterized protein n=1 Tax=Granulicella rosea TaxID=474952 RepID=A0A239CW93_9BACT|nr:hypothetical protein [Granulicella rosea]SNS23814.1 hypothetical protein SAMN05421770_101119 [Granulicella rosea]